MGKNKGLTLIELVTSLGILAIVSLVVVGFISIASKTFRSVNTEVNLQYEAQLTINQLKDLIVDSNRGIVYGLDPIVGDFTQVDMETTGAELAALQSLEAADNMNVGTIKRCILIYNANFLTATNTYEYPVIKIQWDPVTKVLSYTEKVFLTLADLEADQYLETVPSTDYSIMSDYMEGFQVSSMDGEKKLLNMRIALDSEGKNYEASPSVSLRNKVSTDGDIGVIYGGDPVVRPSLVEQVQIEKAGVVVTADTVEIGNQVQYSANVKLQFGANDSMRGVQWTLTGNSTNGTESPSSISQTGLLTVSTYELSSQLVCTATSLSDPSKKAVLIITVDNSRGEFGYVSGVSLGGVLYGDIAAASAPGGPYVYYGIDYSNTSTYITYVNEDKLTAAEKGVTWQVITDAPAGSYEVGQIPTGAVSYGLEGKSPIYIKAYYGAMGYEFQIKATSKADNYEGSKISVMKTFIVSGLQEPLVELQPVLNINFSSTNLSRNGFITATSDIQNVVQPVVSWTIDYSGDSDFSETNTRRSKSNVYRENMSDGSQKLYAKSQLDWNREFTFKLRMQVTGLTNKGNQVNQTIERTVTIPAVQVMVTPNAQIITYNSEAASIPTSYTFSNLNVGTAGAIDNNLNPSIGFSQVVYSYQERRWNGSLRDRTYDFWDSDITYNQVTKNIILTRSLMSDIDWIRSDGTNSLDFLMVFTYSGNRVTYPIQYVFKE